MRRGSPHLPVIASWVFRPWPVMQSTTLSSARIAPVAMSFRVQAVVTPPAVSAKMPSHSARRRMPSTTSPAELLGDLEAHGLRAFGVVGPEIDVYEAPAVFAGDLGTEAVHVVVRAMDADDLRAVDERPEDFALL